MPRRVVDNAQLEDPLAVVAGGALKCEALPQLDESCCHGLAAAGVLVGCFSLSVHCLELCASGAGGAVVARRLIHIAVNSFPPGFALQA